MTTGLIDIMKRASLDVMDANQMCDLRYGTVVSVSPLKVQITNQFTIPEKLLVVPKHLTDYETELSFDDPNVLQVFTTWDMSEEPSTESDPLKIAFKNKVKHKITIYNALKVGDKVALIRKTGGQSYFILDRVLGGD